MPAPCASLSKIERSELNIGTIRSPAAVLGRTISPSWFEARTRMSRRSKSTSSQRRPNTSPRRSPEVAATSTGPRADRGAASTTASTCSRVGDQIWRGGRPTRGSLSATFSRTSSSSTAVLSMARSGASTLRTVFAEAPAEARREAYVLMSAPVRAASGTRPNARSRSRVAAQLGVAEQTAADRVARARKAGFLTPAQKGRAGALPGPRLRAGQAE